MALPKIDNVQLQFLDTWFSNLVDSVNYDLQKIEDAVPALVNVLTTIDTNPIQFLNESLMNLVNTINDGFSQIDERLSDLESRLR